MKRVRLRHAHEWPEKQRKLAAVIAACDGDPMAPTIGKVIPHDSRELAVIWPDTDGAVKFYQHAELIDVEKPRAIAEGDHLRVQRRIDADLAAGSVWRHWIGCVRKLFGDGHCVIDPVAGVGDFAGAYMLRDLDGFEHLDGAPIVPHPAIPCGELRGGCSRNPLGACLRCGDLG